MGAPDVAVVGSGLIGGSIAFELARAKLRVILLDRQEPGQEASWAAAGMLAPAPETPEAIPLVPLGKASLDVYPEFVAAVEEVSGGRVGYRQNGTLHALFAADAERELSTLVAVHHGLSLPTEAIPLEEAQGLEPVLNSVARAAALLPYEASVDNRALTAAVVAAAEMQGAEVRAGAAVTSLLSRLPGSTKFSARHGNWCPRWPTRRWSKPGPGCGRIPRTICQCSAQPTSRA